MARLPDVQDLGARPTPQSSRQLATVRNPGAVGEAVADLGAKVSTVVERLEEIHDEADVRRLDVEHAARAREIRLVARQARGVNAEGARTKADEDLRLLDASIIGQARSRTARQALETLVSRRTSLERDSISEYALRETTTTLEAGMTARIDASVQEAEDRWDNAEAVDQALNTAVTEIQNRGGWRGAHPDQIASEVAATTSRVRSAVVDWRIQAEDYRGALDYLDLHSAEIDRERESNLRQIINTALRGQGQSADGAWAVSGAPPEAAPADPLAAPGEAPPPVAAVPASDRPAPGRAPADQPIRDPVNDGPIDQPTRFTIAGRWVVGDGRGATRRRSGGRVGAHQGLDIFERAGSPFPIGQDFEVVESHASRGAGGNIARVRIGNAEWLAMHLPDLPAAGRYRAGAAVIRSGDTGNATSDAPHVHWQPANAEARAIYAQGRRATAAHLTGGQQSASAEPPRDGTRIDIDAAYARIAAMPWSVSRKERARAEVRQIAATNDQVQQRNYQDADNEINDALAALAARNTRLTNVSQLPAGALSRASPETRRQMYTLIQTNNQPREPEANSPVFVALIGEAAEDRQAFLARNPERLRGTISDAEVAWVARQQAEMRSGSGVEPSQVNRIFGLLAAQGGVGVPAAPTREQGRRAGESLSAAHNRMLQEARGRIIPAAIDRIRRTHPSGTVVTEEMIMQAIRAETPGLTLIPPAFQGVVRGIISPASNNDVRIPARAIPMIDRDLRSAGIPRNDQNRRAIYLRNRAEYDAAN